VWADIDPLINANCLSCAEFGGTYELSGSSGTWGTVFTQTACGSPGTFALSLRLIAAPTCHLSLLLVGYAPAIELEWKLGVGGVIAEIDHILEAQSGGWFYHCNHFLPDADTAHVYQ